MKKSNDHDYPITRCIETAVPLMESGAKIYQKWTCAHCGSRQTMETPNVFFERGICENCKGESPIILCNYLLHVSSGARP